MKTRVMIAVAVLFLMTSLTSPAWAVYHAGLGRFLQRDPGPGVAMRAGGSGMAVGNGFAPRDQYRDGMNLYQYVRSNPATFLDTEGLCASGSREPRPGYRPKANGCGSENEARFPNGGPAGIWTFEPACNNHDICYGTCNSNKTHCDRTFRDEMYSACYTFWNNLGQSANPIAWLLFDSCMTEARSYYEAVNNFGDDAYKKAQNAACDDCKCPPPMYAPLNIDFSPLFN